MCIPKIWPRWPQIGRVSSYGRCHHEPQQVGIHLWWTPNKKQWRFRPLPETISSWWLNQPTWKIWVKMGSSSPNRAWKTKKYLSCHHPKWHFLLPLRLKPLLVDEALKWKNLQTISTARWFFSGVGTSAAVFVPSNKWSNCWIRRTSASCGGNKISSPFFFYRFWNDEEVFYNNPYMDSWDELAYLLTRDGRFLWYSCW